MGSVQASLGARWEIEQNGEEEQMGYMQHTPMKKARHAFK